MKPIKYALLLLLMIYGCKNSVAQNSVRTIDSLLQILKLSKEDTAKVNILNRLSSSYRLNKQLDNGKRYADSALLLADKLDYKKGKADAYIRMGAYYFDHPKHRDEAVNNYQAAATIYQEISHKPGIILCYFDMGNLYINSSDYKEALIYHQLALKLKQENGANKKDIATSFNNIGLTYHLMGNYIESAKSHMQAVNIRREIGDMYALAGSLLNLGSIYYAQGNYPEALKYFLEVLKIGEQNSFKQYIADGNNNLGLIYGVQKNYTEALKYYYASLNVNKESGKKVSIAKNYINIGNVYDEQSDFAGAMNAYQTALTYYKEAGWKPGIAGCYNNIGLTFNKQQNFTEAYKYVSASLNIFEEIGDKRGIAGKLMNIGSILSEQAAFEKRPATDSKYSESLRYINKSLPLAKEIKAMGLIKDIYELLAITHERMKDYKKALEYKNLFIQYKDSLLNDETTRKLEQQRTQYEVEKAVAEEKIQQEKILAEQKFKNEKELAESNAKHDLEIAEEKLRKEKAVEIEKMQYQFALAEKKAEQEKLFAAQEFENERKLTDENARHQQQLSEEKASQQVKDAQAQALLEKEKADKKRRTDAFIAGLAGLGLFSLFVIIFIRQRNQKRRTVEKAETGHKMAELELQSLRAQLNPHFMFNSLNAIQDLILKEDNDRSHLYLSRFAKLLRLLLDNANQPFVSVKQEMEFLELYLSLENLRIPDLQVSIEKNPKLNTEERMIPNMMLQPYIENAIWHGLSNKKGERKLQIRIHENENATEFEIEDNGVGRKKAAEIKSLYRKGHTSKGMELLSKRFSLLSKEYGAAIQTTVTDLGNGTATGTLVKIDVPFSLSEQAKQIVHDTNHNN